MKSRDIGRYTCTGLLMYMFILCLPFTMLGQGIVKGRVVDEKGSGIASVAVSDGDTVVWTDSRGDYAINTNHKSSFVFASLPNGFEFSNSSTIPNFFYRIEKGRKRYDFRLNTVDKDKHVIVFGADPQIASVKDGERWVNEIASDMDSLLLADYGSYQKAGILLGDIVADKFDLFSKHLEGIQRTGIPFFHLAGNHDMDYDMRSHYNSKRTYEDTFGPRYYSFNIGDVHFVVLDNVYYLGRHSQYINYLEEQQFRWLVQDLSRLPHGSSVVICSHIPIEQATKFNDSGNRTISPGGMYNKLALFDILKPYHVHYFAGHTHQNDQFETVNGFFHETAAISGQWWTTSNNSDGTPLGYAVAEIRDNGKLSWYYKSAGFPKEFQMRIYPPTSQRDSLIVNIWNYDDKWKVEWYKDDEYMGTLTPYEGVDFHTLGQLKNYPPEATWIRATKNYHMFYAKHNFNNEKILIKATDRFGNIYSETIFCNHIINK